MENILFKNLTNQKTNPPALWMMRQAGRYLPEYRDIRTQAGSFWNLCFDPKLAAEVTLQPIRRFDYDAAIIFSDILVIPKALGQMVDFAPNHGPILGPLNWEKIMNFSAWDQFEKTLTPVYQAITETKQSLDSSKDLIGFSGSPWTIATYMLDGGKGDQSSVSRQPLTTIKNLDRLLKTLEKAIILHLINQIKAGATVLQIFDSWAEIVPLNLREEILFAPLSRIVTAVRDVCGDIPIIYFGRGISDSYLELTQKKLSVALGVDQYSDLEKLDQILPTTVPLQGNLDPELLVTGGEELDKAVYKILKVARNRPFVFNLGHGILPNTPIAHVEQVCRLVRQYS